MAINFNPGDIVVVKQSYVQNTVANESLFYNGASRANNVRGTVTKLGSLQDGQATVTETGTVNTVLEDGFTQVVRSYIRLVPLDKTSSLYANGQGFTVYWEDDTTINNMFELSTAWVVDTQSKRALNLSGSAIGKGLLVRVAGFDATQQLPTVELASAASSNTAPVFGITEEEIANNGTGSVLIEGHYQGIDTSAFSINDIVFLSDTPGEISQTQGSTSAVVGRVVTAASVMGAIAIKGIIPLAAAGVGGPGTQGSTGVAGNTGVQGNTGIGFQGVQGTTGTEGVTGFLGSTGLSGATGAQGVAGIGVTGFQGSTGVQGFRGFTGLQGIQGVTGTLGVDGNTGILGVDGETGVQGVTGILGIDGATGITGATGIAGNTGVFGNTGAGGILIRDTFTGSVTNGQTVFTLSQAPVDATLVGFEVNGVVYRDTTHITISGTTLTWSDAFAVQSSDIILAIYS
jgi:hypothetical protein